MAEQLHDRPEQSIGEPAARGPIVVPIDGSAESRALLPVARAVAAIWDGESHLLHVTAAPPQQGPLREAVGLTEADLAGFVLHQRTGNPADVILKHVQEQAARLVIMATHGWTSGSSAHATRVAEAVLRRCDRPLMLVSREAGAGFLPEHAPFSRLLLPLNGSLDGEAPLVAIALLIGRPDAAVDVLHIVSTVANARHGTFTLPRYVDQPYHEWEEWRREFSARFEQRIGREPAHIHVAVGDPGKVIVSAARQYGSDLIILAWKQVWDGDHAPTLRAVLRHAPCPVLVVPSDASKGESERSPAGAEAG